MKLLFKIFLWLGAGLFGKHYRYPEKGTPRVLVFAFSERDANCAMREWVEALDAGAKWSIVEDA